MSQSIIEKLLIENARMRNAIQFATAPDMWQEQADGMLDYRYSEWYVDVLNASLETPATDAAIAEMRNEWMAQGVDEFSASEDAKVEKWLSGDEYASYASIMAEEFAANLRAGIK
ncbi:hypothetical protein GW590_08370 [Rahnella sp. SAP-1]|uniref:Uncharacterized protein n=1 Tax=Rouxiella aceris TaxID=2703884 RepID=A0A848MFE1_9GAMM|nr:hypothetical protein [Rouxiella aceris]NMP26877.1 hypothetical protein [Rouxiella aceris]